MTSAAKSLSSVLSSSRVSLATPSCLDTCPPLNLTRRYSTVGDGTPIGRADASIDHPLSTSSFLKILAESDLPTTYPSPLLTITPSSVEDKEGPLSDERQAAASDLGAAAPTTICTYDELDEVLCDLLEWTAPAKSAEMFRILDQTQIGDFQPSPLAIAEVGTKVPADIKAGLREGNAARQLPVIADDVLDVIVTETHSGPFLLQRDQRASASAGSDVHMPAPDLPTVSVGEITAFRLFCKAGFQPDMQATVRPPERSSAREASLLRAPIQAGPGLRWL